MSLHFSPIAPATPAFRHNRQVFHRRACGATRKRPRVSRARNAGGGRVMERKAERHGTFVDVLCSTPPVCHRRGRQPHAERGMMHEDITRARFCPVGILSGYWTTLGYANSRTGQLADATGDFACLVFVLLAASARPRVVQLSLKFSRIAIRFTIIGL